MLHVALSQKFQRCSDDYEFWQEIADIFLSLLGNCFFTKEFSHFFWSSFCRLQSFWFVLFYPHHSGVKFYYIRLKSWAQVISNCRFVIGLFLFFRRNGDDKYNSQTKVCNHLLLYLKKSRKIQALGMIKSEYNYFI